MSILRIQGAIICLVMLQQALSAGTPPGLRRSWNSVTALQAGQKVDVQTLQPKQHLKGALLSSNDDGITILTVDGEQTIARANVYRITENRRIWPALLIGAGVGAAVYAIGGPKTDFTASGHFFFAAAVAGLGMLVGWAVGSAGRRRVIYQAF